MGSTPTTVRTGLRSADGLRAQLLTLQATLCAHEDFWRRSPFHEYTPPWVASHPRLAEAVLSLPSDAAATLSRDHRALVRWLKPWMPALDDLVRQCTFPAHPPPEAGPDRFFAHVPGDKRAQVEAFASAVSSAGLGTDPWLEWCSGKGHLGRWLGHRSGRSVVSLEWDRTLCADGRRLAARARTQQDFCCLDVRAPAAAYSLSHRHVVALHACGDLHRRLLALVAEHSVPALDLAPCCYDRTTQEVYAGLNPEATLAPDRLALRLAVTDMCNGRARDRWRRVDELGWKLAFKVARHRLTGVSPTTPLLSTPRAWSCLTLSEWCQRVAVREGFRFPADTDWSRMEEEGRRLRHRFERLNLPRLALRRALEVWLVVDIGLYLSRLGYRTSISAFCSDTLTPRNLVVSARNG